MGQKDGFVERDQLLISKSNIQWIWKRLVNFAKFLK
jgi:hypothetical protein